MLHLITLSDGGQLRYVSFEWLTPNRQSIAEQGVTPDLFAEDTRFPNTISASGRGLKPGQTVEIVVDGEVVGTTTADEDGSFDVLALGPLPEVSPVQGEAIVHLDTDTALQIAYDAVVEQRASAMANAAD